MWGVTASVVAFLVREYVSARDSLAHRGPVREAPRVGLFSCAGTIAERPSDRGGTRDRHNRRRHFSRIARASDLHDSEVRCDCGRTLRWI